MENSRRSFQQLQTEYVLVTYVTLLHMLGSSITKCVSKNAQNHTPLKIATPIETTMGRKATPGTCISCKQILTKIKMRNHLLTCSASKQTGSLKKSFCIEVTATGTQDYWIHLKSDSQATLKQLDSFLRKT